MTSKKILALILTAAIASSMSACGSTNNKSVVNSEKVTTSTANQNTSNNTKNDNEVANSNKTEKNSNVNQNKQTENSENQTVTETNTNDDNLTNEKAFEITAKTLKDYFDLDIDKNKLDSKNITDMGTYWIVFADGAEVRISLEDQMPFLIKRGCSSDYSETPLLEEEAKEYVMKFIGNSPLNPSELTLSESNYELKYDSTEKEYYIFTFLKSGKDSESRIFIKINTYTKEICEIQM